MKKGGENNKEEKVDAPAEDKKKWIVVKVRKSTKKSTRARVLGPDSLNRLKEYPEDDDMEFVAQDPVDVAQELEAPEEVTIKLNPLQNLSPRKNLWPLSLKKLL